jgi:hypothetical protein
MEDMLVTTSSKFLTLLIFFFLSTSCETINELTGLAKPELDDSLALETPDLVLPPDFGKEPRASMVESKQNIQQKNNAPQISQPMMSYQTINPRITNYLSPRINVQSSPTPSDSLEKFKINKKFTIGEWVYSQYVDGFKRGNLYYRPVYDKGYNFSRRYIPGSNTSSFSNLQSQPIIDNRNTSLPLSGDDDSKFNTFDQLPVID